MNYAIFGIIWTNFAVPLDAGTAALVASLMAQIGPWFKLCVGAYLMSMMLIAAWSSDAESAQRLFRSLFLAAILYTIAFTAPAFDYYVTQLVHGTTAKVMTAAANLSPTMAPIPEGGIAYDNIASRVFAVGLKIYDGIPRYSMKSVPLGIGVLIYWYFSFWCLVIMFAIYLVSYTLTAFLIGMGPLFIPLYFFPFTRKYFDGWLSCIVGAMLVQIFNAALVSMFLFIIGYIINLMATGLAGTNLAQDDGGVIIGEFMMLLVLAAVIVTFALVAGGLTFIACRIAGGAAHTAIGKIPIPSFSPGYGGGSGNGGGIPMPQPAGAVAAPGGGGGGSGPHGHGQDNTPHREHAFSRHVGSAP